MCRRGSRMLGCGFVCVELGSGKVKLMIGTILLLSWRSYIGWFLGPRYRVSKQSDRSGISSEPFKTQKEYILVRYPRNHPPSPPP